MGQIRAEDLITHPAVKRVVIANRNAERAAELASRLDIESAPFDRVDPLAFDSV
ncbi:MAG: hypothetical protein EBZ88_08650, partial [Actinobacteria bacterium]|nr:hypothetical protein [Actinomycetota bacterium]